MQNSSIIVNGTYSRKYKVRTNKKTIQENLNIYRDRAFYFLDI